MDEWLEQVQREPNRLPFRNASLWKADTEASDDTRKLSFSRAYTLALSPQIVYTKSKLLAQLVSSKVYHQLEFHAVGNWWLYDGSDKDPLRRLPNGREDIFLDKGIDNKAKRSLMKFLKFVVGYENQTEVWEAHGDSNLQEFLSSQFQLPPRLQTIISTLTLSFDATDKTLVRWALPRIARHLTSIGVFGPGFGAVLPKWGGGSEIAQVACRAGAVGGGVYVLGTGVENSHSLAATDDGQPWFSLILSNGETVRTRHYVNPTSQTPADGRVVSKIIVVVSSGLPSIFTNSVEGAPQAAVSVVTFPPNPFSQDGIPQAHPVYIMVHTSETGECPAGQCILYATTSHTETSKAVLEDAIAKLLAATEDKATVLYTLYYEQHEVPGVSSLDLAFDDQVLDGVETQWKTIMSYTDGDEHPPFMQFAEREGMNADDDNEEY